MIRGESIELIDQVCDALDKNGSYQHTVMDNGGKPFTFLISDHSREGKIKVVISETETRDIFELLIADEIFLGSGTYDDTQNLYYEHFKCNTVLFVSGRKCVWLGMNCVEFELDEDERVDKFISTLGNSCVPYGWIETNKHYIGLEGLSCENYKIPKSSEVRALVKSGEISLDCVDLDLIKEHLQPFETRIIHGQIW